MDDYLTVSEFERTVDRLEQSWAERTTALQKTMEDGVRRIETRLDRYGDTIHRHSSSLQQHDFRLQVLETKPSPPTSAQIVATHAQAVTPSNEEGVIKISASKTTWAAVAAIFGVIQVVGQLVLPWVLQWFKNAGQ